MNSADPWRALADLSGTAGPAEEIATRATALMSDAGWSRSLLGSLFDKIEDPHPRNPMFRARRDASGARLRLYRDTSLSLSALLLPAGLSVPPLVTAPGQIVILRALAGGPALIRWRAGNLSGDFSAATAPPLEKPRRVSLASGDVVRIDGREDAWRLVTSDREAIVLKLVLSASQAPMLREYRIDDGRLTRVAATCEHDMRAAMLMTVLREFGRSDAAPLFAAPSEHPAFFVRWRAMREWLALDAESAMPRLTAMADGDPHPEVRAAAIAARHMLIPSCRA